MDAVKRALQYHESTKHRPHAYAASPGYLDWDTQPEPFRVFDGAPRVPLPLAADRLQVRYRDLYRPAPVDPAVPDLESIGSFFELALGLTSWKQAGGSRWALRSNPSSGNLHPTEGYAVVPAMTGLTAGVYHYVSRDHCLERRCALAGGLAQELLPLLPEDSFLTGLSSIHWREAWKYGERAFRYCQHDIGHAIATLRYAAAAHGWSAALLDGFGDARVAALLGLDREEDHSTVDRQDREHPDLVMLVGRRHAVDPAPELERSADALVELVRSGSWEGRPNRLSPEHVEWRAIDEVAEATRKPPSATGVPPEQRDPLPRLEPTCETAAATIIRQRRSAVALDGSTSISSEQFHAMLDAVLPRPGVPPWDALPWPPRLHLGIFVHRVRDLSPGLYLLERTPAVHDDFVEVLGPEVQWERVEECPEHLRLFRLREGDCRRAAAHVSCHQDIAADGAFSLGMIAEFRSSVAAGAWEYRRLFWEAGALGQVLYLEAEAAGVRATGIGCYFDDVFHEIFGLTDDRFQSMYHFTVGGAVDDPRLVTLPPYAQLQRRRESGGLRQ